MQEPRVRALFLDIGGVLGTNGWDRNMRRRAAQVFGLDEHDLDERHHLTFDAYEEGRISLDEYLNRVVFHTPRPFTLAQFRAYMLDQSQPDRDMLALCRQLKAACGCRVATVSNEGRELTLHRIDKFGLAGFVDFFVVSSFVHRRKPDIEIYQMALDIGHVAPAEAAYVDDRLLFVEVAQRLGMHGVHHTDLDSTRTALAKLGLGRPEAAAPLPAAPSVPAPAATPAERATAGATQ